MWILYGFLVVFFGLMTIAPLIVSKQSDEAVEAMGLGNA